jgi:hypothetical protein
VQDVPESITSAWQFTIIAGDARVNIVGVPGLWLQKVPERKQVKNRAHFDLHADDRDAAVARLLGLGATKVGDYDEYGTRWTTLQDVEGNEFCVA